jgi:hypothetical protein
MTESSVWQNESSGEVNDTNKQTCRIYVDAVDTRPTRGYIAVSKFVYYLPRTYQVEDLPVFTSSLPVSRM